MQGTKLKKHINDSFVIISVLSIYIVLSFLINDYIKYNIFISVIYTTFLISIGIITYKTKELNTNKLYIFVSLTFFITGIVQSIYLFITFTVDNMSMVFYLEVAISILIDILPLLGIYFSFKYIQNNKSLKLVSFKILTIILIFILIISLLKSKLYSKEILIYIELIMNILLLILGFTTYSKINDNNNYLDCTEKKLLKKIVIIISFSRILLLFSNPMKNYYIYNLNRGIINSMLLVYIYKYTTYSNFKKTYDYINEVNIALTEKNNALKELFEYKEDRLKSKLDTSNNCIVVFDDNKEIMYANKKFNEIFGYKYNIHIYKDYLENQILNKGVFLENINKLYKHKKVIIDTIQMKNNKIYQVTFSPVIIKDKVQGMLCIFVDITNKVISENKIKDLNKRHEEFLESIGDGIIVLEDNKVVYVNKSCKMILKDKINEIDFRLYDKKSKIEKILNIDGEDIYLELEFSDYIKEDIVKTIVLIRDVTMRKKAQIMLKKNQESYSKFIDILPDGICLIGNDLKINYANKSLLHMLEMDNLYQLIHLDIKDIINLTKEEKNLFDRKIKKVIKENKYMILLEYELITYNKNKVQVEVNAIPFYDEENYLMFIIKDLTYKKTSEMAEKEILERFKSDKIKTEFFANISHELKTPLNVISSSNQLLNSNYKNGKIEDYNDNIKYHIDLVKQSSYRIQRLISNIIDLTKMESGLYKLKLSRHNVVSVIEDLFMKIEGYANKKDISIVFDTDNEEIYSYIDKPEIERIMLNLLSNCIKFTDKRGSISVNIYDEINEFKIVVKDTGTGIPRYKIDLIFEEFGQVDKTLSRNAEGSGIGLSIVKNLIQLHEGSIEVESLENEFTKFTITLPIKNSINEEYLEDRRIYNTDEKISIEFSDIYY